jgi:hypothetical protein
VSAEENVAELFARPGAALAVMSTVTDQLRGRVPCTDSDGVARRLIADALGPDRSARQAVDRLCEKVGEEQVAVVLTLASLAKTAPKRVIDSRERSRSIADLEDAVSRAQAWLAVDVDAGLLEQLEGLRPLIRDAGRRRVTVKCGPRCDEGTSLQWQAMLRRMGASKRNAAAIFDNIQPVPVRERE